MSLKKFKKIVDVDLLLLRSIKILVRESKIIQVNNYPDYDRTPYGGMTVKGYVFDDEWSFANDYNAIINCEIAYIKGFHFDDIEDLSKAYEIPYFTGDSFDGILNDARELETELMDQRGFELNFDGFKLDDLSIERVDNINKRVHFSGAFNGDSYSIEPVDWKILVECSFDGFVSGDKVGSFYPDLLAESYSLKNAGSYKLSYFLIFSALENYINGTLKSEKDEVRLLQKLKDMFKIKFDDLGIHEIYTSIIGNFKRFEDFRNAIAHGNRPLDIDEELVSELTLFVLMIIASYEHNLVSFDDLIKCIVPLKS